MARCRRREACLGLFLCELDGFKRINDEFGHLEGNHVLKAAAAAALRECCRSYDYVARMGGDEFVVLAPDIQRFRDAVEQTGARLGYSGLSSSFGAVIFVPAEGDGDADTLLAEADRRMYANKRRNKAMAAHISETAKINPRVVEKHAQGRLELVSSGVGLTE